MVGGDNMAWFKFNKNIEPYTIDELKNMYLAVVDGYCVYNYLDMIKNRRIAIECDWLGSDDMENITIFGLHYIVQSPDEYLKYTYFFEAGVLDWNDSDVPEVGWYKYDDNTYSYSRITGDMKVELHMESTEVPSDWNPELGEWINPFINPYFYKVVTECSQYETVPEFLSALADIIREKTNTTEKIKGSDLPSRLENIKTRSKQWSDLDGNIFHVVPDLNNLEGLGSYESIEAPLITSDGKHVYIKTNRSYRSYIYYLDVESGEVTLVSNSEGMSQSGCGTFFEDSLGRVWVYVKDGFADKGYTEPGLACLVNGEITNYVMFSDINSYARLEAMFEENGSIYYTNVSDGGGVYALNINDLTYSQLYSETIGYVKTWFKMGTDKYYVCNENGLLFYITNNSCSQISDINDSGLCYAKANDNTIVISAYNSSSSKYSVYVIEGSSVIDSVTDYENVDYIGERLEVVDDGVSGIYIKHRSYIYYKAYGDDTVQKLYTPGPNSSDKWDRNVYYMHNLYMFISNDRVYVTTSEYPVEGSKIILLPSTEDIDVYGPYSKEVFYKLNK